MSRVKVVSSVLVLLAAVALRPDGLAAQLQTERYIPIGASPGVSGVTSVIGEIEAVDAANLRVTVRSGDGSVTFRLSDETWIWIDRSAQRLTNLRGSYEDCEVGRTVEVKFVDPEARELAEWVKVAAPG